MLHPKNDKASLHAHCFKSIESGTYRAAFTKKVGTEQLCRAIDFSNPLGRGGFGEVWKCEAPGGLMKAIKFVAGSDAEDGNGGARFDQELDAFQQIKSIRHPFLLTLERVEIIDGELVMVMELADRQLLDRFRECHACGLPGIPRDELLAYFADAAEALDMISAKYGLQHLDVKPANLFLVAGHVKVGDYGLVARLDPDGVKSTNGGLTPKYVSPEALIGKPSAQSDQYSLALVYQELLTGTFPYTGRKPQQLMIQHISSEPDLSGLPKVDQPIMAQALAKKPEERFSSCMAFIQALMSAASAVSLPRANMEVRRARVERSMVDMNLPMAEAIDDADSTGNRPLSEVTQNHTLPGVPGLTAPQKQAFNLPKPSVTPQPPKPPSQIVTPAPSRQPKPKSTPIITPAPLSSYVDVGDASAKRFGVVLNPIKTVVTVAAWSGENVGRSDDCQDGLPSCRGRTRCSRKLFAAATRRYWPARRGHLGLPVPFNRTGHGGSTQAGSTPRALGTRPRTTRVHNHHPEKRLVRAEGRLLGIIIGEKGIRPASCHPAPQRRASRWRDHRLRSVVRLSQTRDLHARWRKRFRRFSWIFAAT